jgi:hypothetical protein
MVLYPSKSLAALQRIIGAADRSNADIQYGRID